MMRTITKTYTVWTYDELSEDIKEKALENYCDINVDDGWWDFIYSDAENIGLKITGFDLDRGGHCDGDLMELMDVVCDKIMSEHGKDCETHKTATDYLAQWKALERDEDGDIADSFALETLENDFTYALREDYSIMLQQEYEYFTSRESIEETLRCNEYEFNKTGKID